MAGFDQSRQRSNTSGVGRESDTARTLQIGRVWPGPAGLDDRSGSTDEPYRELQQL